MRVSGRFVIHLLQICGKASAFHLAVHGMKPSLSFLVLSLAFAAPAYAIDERYKPYEPRPELAGRIEVRGDPAPGNLRILWGESFRAQQPGAVMAEGGGGIRIRAAIEALAILVHKDNPLTCITLDQLKVLYAPGAVWGAAGAEGSFAAVPVVHLARKEGFGEKDFFRDGVLKGAALPDASAKFRRASHLLKALAASPGGIAYLPAGYRGDGAKALQLSNGGACAAPTQTSASRAEYPLSRFVWLEGKPEGATLAFFDYVLSAEGQRDAVIAGHFMLPYVFGGEERRKLGLD